MSKSLVGVFVALSAILAGCSQGDICDNNTVNKLVYGVYKRGAGIQCAPMALEVTKSPTEPREPIQEPGIVPVPDEYIALKEVADLSTLDPNGKYRIEAGIATISQPIPYFNGEIDFNGFTLNISNMPIQAGRAGAFAELGPNAYIRNGYVYVELGLIEGNGDVGGIAAVNNGGTIEDMVFIGDRVVSYGNTSHGAGGAVGFNNSGTLRRVSVQGINVSATGQAAVGGLVGRATAALGKKGLITNSDFGGSVTGQVYTGGVVGKAFDTDLIGVTLSTEYNVPPTSITTVGYIAGTIREQNYPGQVTVKDCIETGSQIGHPGWLQVFGHADVTTVDNASVLNP